MKHFLSSAAIVALSFLAVGCSNDDAVVGTTEGQFTTFVGGMSSAPTTRVQLNENGSVSASTLTELTRTSMDRTNVGEAATFAWEQGDEIYVDVNGDYKKSSNKVDGEKVANFKFYVDGVLTDKNEYQVYYVGTQSTAPSSGNGVKVTIADKQTAEGFNNTKHFGASGDCGVATATKQANGAYSFKMDHKAAYLCLLPYAEEPTEGMNYKIKSVKVTSDKEIAGSYNLVDSKLEGGTKEITLTVGTDGNGLMLANKDVATKHIENSLYMVVAPGTHQLTVEITVLDGTTNADVTIKKSFKETALDANKVYDVAYKLSVQREQSDNMVTWNKIAKGIPNVNTAYWLAECGDAHWDANHKVTVNGKEYIGGLWLKKISKIASDYSTSEEEMKKHTKGGMNMDTDSNRKYTFSYKTGTPTNTNDYFFLPACGGAWNDGWGTYNNIPEGQGGSYWLSSQGAYASDNQAWVLFFKDGSVGLIHNPITSMSFGKTNLFQ